MVKRKAKRVARRKARRSVAVDRMMAHIRLVDALEKRIHHIEAFLEPDLSAFHEKQSAKMVLVAVPGAD